jgi:hypothetical protein
MYLHNQAAIHAPPPPAGSWSTKKHLGAIAIRQDYLSEERVNIYFLSSSRFQNVGEAENIPDNSIMLPYSLLCFHTSNQLITNSEPRDAQGLHTPPAPLTAQP